MAPCCVSMEIGNAWIGSLNSQRLYMAPFPFFFFTLFPSPHPSLTLQLHSEPTHWLEAQQEIKKPLRGHKLSQESP